MKEIKFRAWDGNKMLYQEKFSGRDDEYHELISFVSFFDVGDTNLEDWNLMQFTGLKDKNGKEIYSGDFLRFEDGRIGNVGWHSCNPALTVYFDDGGNGEDCRDVWEDEGYKRFEVIGNIYENKELLK